MTDSKTLTISDVAQALGISKTTVSRAISGNGRVGVETRDRVMSYIAQHNYVPNAMAKGLAQSKTYNIGLVMPKDYTAVDLPFFQRCLTGVCDQANAQDYDVVVCVTTPTDISQLERLINNNKVDGVILTRTLTMDLTIDYLKEKGIPFVAIGLTEDPDVIQVDNDHESACRELTSLLLMQKIGRVAMLCGDRSFMVTQSRLKGFLDAMDTAGVKVTPDMVYYDIDFLTNVDKIVDEILSRRFDCILCMDDSICVNVLDKLKRDRITVPSDIKVASFYNSAALSRNIPAVTALSFDAKQLGEEACKTLFKVLSGTVVPVRNLLGYEIAMKESTKKCDNGIVKII